MAVFRLPVFQTMLKDNDMCECWQNVIKTFEQKIRRNGIQSAGGRFGVFYHSMQLFDCSWIKGIKNCK